MDGATSRTPGDVTLTSYEVAAERYRERTPPMSGEQVAFLERVAAEVPGGRLLELGSGPGADADHLEQHGLRVDRTDAAGAFVTALRAQGHPARLLDVRVGSFGGPYDGVLACAVLLHLDREEFVPVLRTARAAVVAGGLLAMTLKEGAGEGWSTAKLDLPRHFTYWSVEEVDTALNAAGWVHREVVRVAGRVEPWLHVLARAPG